MHLQFGTCGRCVKFVKMSVFIILFFISFNGKLIAQEDLLQGVLKTIDAVNETLLQVTTLTDDEENKIGIELDKRISKDFKIGNDTKYDIKNIFNKILKNVNRKQIEYNYKVLKSDEVNAFAIAGGKTFVLTGLLKFVDSDDELAFVIAHEIAHNELKHCVKRIQYSVQASKIDPTLGEVVQVAYSVYSTPYSKYDEFAADDLGVKLMEKAGYNKIGAIQFFAKLKKLEEKYGTDKRDGLNDFISTHPTAEARKNRVENNNRNTYNKRQ